MAVGVEGQHGQRRGHDMVNLPNGVKIRVRVKVNRRSGKVWDRGLVRCWAIRAHQKQSSIAMSQHVYTRLDLIPWGEGYGQGDTKASD